MIPHIPTSLILDAAPATRPAPASAARPALEQRVGRVAHVIHSGGFYGAEKVVCDLAGAQASGAGGVSANCVLALLDPGLASNALADHAAKAGLAVIRLNVARGLTMASLREYARALRSSGTAVAHSHGYKATALHLLSRWAGLHRVPLLVTVHGYPRGSGGWKASLYRLLDIVLNGFAESVVAVSGEMRTYLARRNPLVRPRLIPNGIPTGLAPEGHHPLLKRLADEAADMGAAQGARADWAPVIGSAGRLVPMKNHAALIRAYAEVRRAIPCRLVILGDGPLRGELEALWRDLIPDEPVRLYPFQADVLDWMADMDVFALPSRDGEGLPIALLEAGLLGRAVVATDSGGIPEILRDGATGRLVPKDDPAALYAALLDMLRSPADRAGFGLALRRAVLRDHDIAVTRGRYQEAYAQVLARR